jgi:TonB family protein
MSRGTTRALTFLVCTFLLCAFPSAQTTTGGRYERDGLSFNYPAGWKVEDKSNAQAQHLVLTREGGSALVVVIAHRQPITEPGQLFAANRNIWKPYAEDVARKLGIEKTPPWEETQCEQVGGRQAVGVMLAGRLNGEPTTGEVYALMLGRRFVNVFFVRHDKDESLESPAWKSLLESLKVEEPPDLPPLRMGDKDMTAAGILNGKAIRKPQPEYPGTARSARASGTVAVQVVVDENGDVTSAQAISGHPLLRDSGERAARKAKFSPTKLCGQPVKVTGVVTYNFVLM